MKYLSIIFFLFFINCSNVLDKQSFGDFSIDIPKSWEVKNNNLIDGFELIFTNNGDSIIVSSNIDKSLINLNIPKIDTINNIIVKSFRAEECYIMHTIIGLKSIQLKANNINSSHKILEIKDIFKTLNYKIGTNKKDILNSDFIGNEIYTIDCLYCHGNKDYGLLLTKSLAEISQIRGDDYLFKWIESKGNIANKNSFLNKQAAYKKCEIVKKYSNDEIRSLVLYISKNYSGVK